MFLCYLICTFETIIKQNIPLRNGRSEKSFKICKTQVFVWEFIGGLSLTGIQRDTCRVWRVNWAQIQSWKQHRLSHHLLKGKSKDSCMHACTHTQSPRLPHTHTHTHLSLLADTQNDTEFPAVISVLLYFTYSVILGFSSSSFSFAFLLSPLPSCANTAFTCYLFSAQIWVWTSVFLVMETAVLFLGLYTL